MRGPRGASGAGAVAGGAVQEDRDGAGGADRTTVWKLITLDLGTLSAGTHTFRFGGYNNQKTSLDEFTDIFIDDVVLRAR